ncbi:MAG: hypothetical protein D6772_14300 [Bacteroidetes bacterium]|nr:MAG: hypothetical protein D6772_14300 [Bacteroidota bacterium]
MKCAHWFFYLCVLSCGACTLEKETITAKPPNVLVILVDDMGFSDLGCCGGEIRTPNLDQLAAQGYRFTQFYNSAKCTPSRGALLTGRYPHEVGVGSTIARPDKHYQAGAYQGYLDHGATTIAEFFQAQGYRTGMSGK